MTRPKKIFIIRHGESEGNIDKEIYCKKPDFAIELTEKGRQQAFDAGIQLKNLIGNESLRVYNSSFFRARRTTEYILKSFKDNKTTIREDLRLVEQGWGNLVSKDEQEKSKKDRDEYSHFYFRANNAENGLDLYVRISSFLDTLHRDFQNPNFEDNCLIVGHGLTNRLFIARWLHYSFEQYEEIKNPQNCQFYILELNSETNKYFLTTPLEKHNVYHNWRYLSNNQ